MSSKPVPAPAVTHVLNIPGGLEVLLKASSAAGTKGYSVRIAHGGRTQGIACEYARQTYKSRIGRGLAATCRRNVKRGTPLFTELEALAKVAINKQIDGER